MENYKWPGRKVSSVRSRSQPAHPGDIFLNVRILLGLLSQPVFGLHEEGNSDGTMELCDGLGKLFT